MNSANRGEILGSSCLLIRRSMQIFCPRLSTKKPNSIIHCYSFQWFRNKAKNPVKRQTDTKTQWNTLQVSLFYSFHLRKSKVWSYLAFADLSNIFLIQSLLYFQRSPVTRHRCVASWYVNHITPLSLGRPWKNWGLVISRFGGRLRRWSCVEMH